MTLFGRAAHAHRRNTSLRYHGPESGGLSGEHIELCAEGARHIAESLRQTDGDAKAVNGRFMQSSLCGLHFLFCNYLERRI